MFYEYRQNNSGGWFALDEKAGISVMVIVEADNAEEADRKAERIGLYFDGCDDGRDCSCCGDRWYACSNGWSTSGDEVPSSYGKPITEPDDSPYGHSRWQEPEGFVHYADGRVEPFNIYSVEEMTTVKGEVVRKEIGS